MIHLKKTMMALGLAVLFLLVVAACGTEQQEGTAKQPNTDPGETVGEGAKQPEIDETAKTIVHHMGETIIEGEPKQIASLFPRFTDFLLALEITPIAVSTAGPDAEEFTWYYADQLEGTTSVGWFTEPNFEALLQAEPDLILGLPNLDQVYSSLEKIAPTILLDVVETEEGIKDWRQTFIETAGIIGEEEKAEQVIASYDQQVEEAKQEIERAIGQESVMFLRVTDKELRYYGQKNFDVLYGDLALQPPVDFPGNEDTFAPISLEILPEIDPDHIFLLSDQEENLELVEGNSIWENLTAVREGNVYQVDYELWFQGFGPIGSSLIVEDAVEKLTK
ncbi:iron-siderophore ABC transporter substrate-binding protein [Alkalihalobacillus oceani]|uniref:Iron-siderophore ABC transporter substrate-binding protein n=1 Tax=Halalkalibacter oceani TaxID=1653776 RepID=A0A9X2DSG6_9BACI|nr:iron-siderophore ABC transporter substrate-binding protein [Halalkalibacter oceani]MCM3714745.1 iron-siderophore ABC transporter substrate-binding protein [Halalkalibacter oceani]